MVSSRRPNMLLEFREMLPPFPAALHAWGRWFRERPHGLVMSVSRVLLLLVFYSPLSAGEMICTESCIPFFPMLDSFPRSSPQQDRWPQRSLVPVCSVACFRFSFYKDGNSGHSESDGALTEAPGRPDSGIQTLMFPGLPHLQPFPLKLLFFSWFHLHVASFPQVLFTWAVLKLTHLIRNSRHRRLVWNKFLQR